MSAPGNYLRNTEALPGVKKVQVRPADVSGKMNIKLLLFAQAREIAGDSEIDLILPEESDVGALIRLLTTRFPAFSQLEMKAAVNSEYVEDNHRLHNGDEVAIIPPISGG